MPLTVQYAMQQSRFPRLLISLTELAEQRLGSQCIAGLPVRKPVTLGRFRLFWLFFAAKKQPRQ